MGNNALLVNPALLVDISITTRGSDWLFTVFALFGVAILGHSIASIYFFHKGQLGRSWLHIGPMISTAALSYSYFTMASNLGWTGVPVEFNHIDIGNDVRQVFYVRYVGWVLSFPGLLYLFEMNAEVQNKVDSSKLIVSLSQVFNNMILQLGTTVVFIVGLLIGSLIESSYKWGYFAFSLVAGAFAIGLLVYRQLFGNTKVVSVMNTISITGYSIVLLLYPIAWTVSDGGNVIQPDSEAVFFGILDLIMFFALPIWIIADSVLHGSLAVEGSTSTDGNSNANDDVEKLVENEVPVRQLHDELHDDQTGSPSN